MLGFRFKHCEGCGRIVGITRGDPLSWCKDFSWGCFDTQTGEVYAKGRFAKERRKSPE